MAKKNEAKQEIVEQEQTQAPVDTGDLDPALFQEEEYSSEDLEFPLIAEGWHEAQCIKIGTFANEGKPKQATLRMKIVGGDNDGMEITGFEPLRQEGYKLSDPQTKRMLRILNAFGAKKYADCLERLCKIQIEHRVPPTGKNAGKPVAQIKGYSPSNG